MSGIPSLTESFCPSVLSDVDLAFEARPAVIPVVPTVVVPPAPQVTPVTEGRGPQSRDWCFTCNNFTET